MPPKRTSAQPNCSTEGRGRRAAAAPGSQPRSPAGTIDSLAARLGYRPRRPELLRQAVTHRSAQHELALPANERLEFLGDAILGLVVAGYLYRSHPDLEEGDLTKLKAAAVSEAVLAKVARQLDLGRYLILAKGEEQSGGRSRPSILADTMEAIFAAVYLDRGLTATRKVILGLLEDHLQAIERDEHERDYKTLLQEEIQERHRTPPTYHLVRQSGPDHDRTFVAEVRVGARVLGRGVGKSKKQAEQAAAREALTRK